MISKGWSMAPSWVPMGIWKLGAGVAAWVAGTVMLLTDVPGSLVPD